MSDYIEREKAFDAVFMQFCASSDETEAALNSAIEEIKAIPAADVWPVRHGWWARLDDRIGSYLFYCSECGERAYYVHGMNNSRNKGEPVCGYHFCPNCGADMREES